MRTWMLGLALAALPLLAQAQTRAEAPIRGVELSDGTPRYAVPITVGGVTVDAGLDSGSTGLRVLPGVVPPDQAKGARGTSYSYDSGTELNGVISEVTVGIGGLSGPAPVELVRKAGCRGLARCPAEKVPFDQFGIQGNGLPGEGFKAILGINMGPDDTPNPLMKLGVKRWIIELPLRDDPKPGRLILNPTDQEIQGYTIFKIDPAFADRHGGLHDALRGCVVDTKTKRSFCGPMDLDTGAPGIQVGWSTAEAAFPAGDPAQVVFARGNTPVLAADFEVGARAVSSRMSVRTEPRQPGARIYLGVMPYMGFSVLYDPAAGTIGLKPR